jgi:hypothetical protein
MQEYMVSPSAHKLAAAAPLEAVNPSPVAAEQLFSNKEN